jgi:hypothetical protein
VLKGSEWADSELGAQEDALLSECARGHVAFRPRKGDALLFYSLAPDGKQVPPSIVSPLSSSLISLHSPLYHPV